jgi:hypothetical protein
MAAQFALGLFFHPREQICGKLSVRINNAAMEVLQDIDTTLAISYSTGVSSV